MILQPYPLYAVYQDAERGWTYGLVLGWSGQNESPGSMTPWVNDIKDGRAARVAGNWWTVPSSYEAHQISQRVGARG